MKTTIEVSDSTKRMLASLKRQLKKNSYDEVIYDILLEEVDTPRSLAGAYPDLK